MFMKKNKVVKAFSILILFIWLGFYILRMSESLLGDMIGFANIGFFLNVNLGITCDTCREISW